MITVRQMAERLNEIVRENDRIAARGGESINRNDLPMYVQVRRGSARKGEHYYPVRFVSSAWKGIILRNQSEVDMMNIVCDESLGLVPTSQGYKPRGADMPGREDVDAFGPVKQTRYPELQYQHQGRDNWRILARDTGAAIGPLYPTREALLDDLDRFARVYGCN